MYILVHSASDWKMSLSVKKEILSEKNITLLKKENLSAKVSINYFLFVLSTALGDAQGVLQFGDQKNIT